MPRDLSKSQPTHTSSRAAAHNPGSAGISRPAVVPGTPLAEESLPLEAVVQRQQVIQLWGADEELGKVIALKPVLLGKIAADDYAGAMTDYMTLKTIISGIYQEHWKGNRSVNKKHTEPVVKDLREVIAAFDLKLQTSLDTCKNHYEALYHQYYGEYNDLYNQIATNLLAGQDITALNVTLKQKRVLHNTAIELMKPLATKITALSKSADFKNDKNAAYGNKESINNTKLNIISIEALTSFGNKNFSIKMTSLAQVKNIKKTTDDPGNLPLKNDTALILLAGTDERKDAIAALFVGDLPKQVSIFTQINKHHREDNIADVVTLIQTAGTDKLVQTLAFIDAVGIGGTIADIKNFYTGTRAVQGDPSLVNLTAFFTGIAYTSMKELEDFVKAAGALVNLVTIKSLWATAKPNNNLATAWNIYNPGIIPPGLAEHSSLIATAFAGKAGKSTAAAWGELLTIPDWSADELINLALAFDKNDGNCTTLQWIETAKKDAGLKTKPDEVRATARLNHFADKKWYDEHDRTKISSADRTNKKYTQLLYALLGKENITGIGNIDIKDIKGDFLSTLVSFHKHIAPYQPNDKAQGADRDNIDTRSYARSNASHPLNVQYGNVVAEAEGKAISHLLQPVNAALLALQQNNTNDPGARFPSAPKAFTPHTPTTPGYRTGKIKISSAGLPSNNFQVLGEQQNIILDSAKNKKTAKEKFFGFPAPPLVSVGAPGKSRSIDDEGTTTDDLVDKQKTSLSDKIKINPANPNFHDHLLADRGNMVANISAAINAISGGPQRLFAIGTEGHPSLMLLIPKVVDKFHYDSEDFGNTSLLISRMVTDFNGAPGQEVQLSQRASFGFQRPTLTDTSDSVRLWPGYTPVESLIPGLKVLVEKISSKAPLTPALTNIAGMDLVTTDVTRPILHVEALKTAMRHAFVALSKKIDGGAPEEKKRVYKWLKTRLLIKLKQSELLLDKAPTVYGTADAPSTATQQEKDKHYLITADMIDKLQEYTMLYTATTLDTGIVNPNANHNEAGKFKDATDAYESNVVSTLGAKDYRIYYLDSGEQALITAGILANRFDKKAAPTGATVAKSNYISRNPYFEVEGGKGAMRSNLNKDDTNATVVHADMSPAITSKPGPGLADNFVSEANTQNAIKHTWQNDADGSVKNATIVPIIDITNSTIAKVNSLGFMPNNFILVESLTKFKQLGTDKFAMGRLIAVSSASALPAAASEQARFLAASQAIVGPVANKAYNPLLAQIRANMDKALHPG
ncbi:hypothetical protein SAMN05428988_5881 [Chitinophaga sp. YR573]|uniref:hypothetical protein n=1 Tax=Chitinophaga sp. YR573 TaxID=1881040 RepID=UPI0008C3A087|nr:hypothetical protein [Chitinophaga sp. YR573]SEW44869.1 hypothetical protein SAMN05428988_5881 [Chitinophaga sp. YR573]